MSKGELPDGWVISKLGEIADWGTGGTPSRRNSSYFQGNVPWLKTGDLGPRIVFQTSEFISEDAVKNSNAKLFEIGSIALAMYGATIGKTSILGLQTTTNQACAVGKPIDNLTTTDFLYYLIKNQTDQFVKKGKGGAQPNISQGIIREHEIPLPPPAEQREIAKRLDELLGQVERIKARVDALPAVLKRFRQSVLAAAVSGKLTEDWREVNGDYLHPLSRGWKWNKIPDTWSISYYADVVESRLGKMLDKAKNTGTPTRYLGNINVRWFWTDLTKLQNIEVSDDEIEQLSVAYKDVLICEGGEPGRSAIWNDTNHEPIIFQKALHRARVSESLLPEWLVFNLKSDADQNILDQLFTGTTIKHLTGRSLKKYPLRIPPLPEQTEIVSRVESLFSFADKVEAQIQSAQAKINHLSQSILAKAFRGELTAEWRAAHPELITGEHSAEALLARIQAERAASNTPTKKKRARKMTKV